MNTSINKPDIVQSFDYYKDRVYKKYYQGFIFGCEKIVRVDRLDSWNQWEITCSKMPDLIVLNGEEYKLVKVNVKKHGNLKKDR